MKRSELTSRERYFATFRHEEADRVPVLLDVYPICCYTPDVYWYTQFDKVDKMLELGCDPAVFIWLPDPVINSDVKIRTWREKNEKGEIVITKEFDTPAGKLRQSVIETDDWCSKTHNYWVQQTLAGGEKQTFGIDVFDDWNVSRRTEPWLKGKEDIEKLKYILQKPEDWKLDEWRHDTQRAMEFAQERGLLTFVRRTIVSDAVFWFCDIPWFMTQLYDDPGFVSEFFDVFEKVAAWQAELALDMKPDVFQRRGWYDTPDFWGGPRFNEYIVPSINMEADLAHEAGVEHCYLLTEAWGPHLDKFAGLNTDIFWGLDPYRNKVDFKTVKESIGKTKTILGGISQEQDLILGTPEKVRKAVRYAIDTMAPGGGFILGASSSVSRYTNWENIKAVIDEALEYGRYDRR